MSFPVEISSDTSHRLPGSAIASERPSQKRFGNSRERARVTEVSDRARDSRSRGCVVVNESVQPVLADSPRLSASVDAYYRFSRIECPLVEVDTFGFLDRSRLVIDRIR